MRRTKHKRRSTRKIRGGKHGAGTMERIPTLSEDGRILAAGHFGLIVKNSRQPHLVTKLFYDLHTCSALPQEAALQEAARSALRGIAHVPKILQVVTRPVEFQNRTYLCGITMEQIPIPEDFTVPVHMLLGYDHYDIDTEWGRDLGKPVSSENPTRGFHAGPAMLEAIWKDEGITTCTIESVARTMGRGTARLLDAGILPLDIEWMYGGAGQIWVVDFGLCEFRRVDKMRFLLGQSSDSLGVNYYVPRPGMRGYDAFLEGYWSV